MLIKHVKSPKKKEKSGLLNSETLEQQNKKDQSTKEFFVNSLF